MDQHPRRPFNKQSLMDINLDVTALLTSDIKWRPNKINELLFREDSARILVMHVGAVEDRHIWAYTNNGSYTVKSGYWLVCNHPPIPPTLNPSLDRTLANLKHRVWKIKTVPKIRLFLWRALSGALVVSDKLRSRGLQVDTSYRLCGQNP